MKAALLTQFGTSPVFSEVPEPVPQNSSQILISVKASAIKNLDKLRASGKHYSSYKTLPAIVGMDGVGVLENGQRVYAQGITGMIAEMGLVATDKYTLLPDGLDYVTAAALPNAVLGAAMALRFRAGMKPGDTVLINGATGVTGQLAVQIARHYGASQIIATGRNHDALERLKQLGADTVVSLKQDDEEIIKQLKDMHLHNTIDIVIDYLWGKPIELIITALKGQGGLNSFTPRVRIVTVGAMAGETISLTSGTLRSSAFEILGSGFGSLSEEDFRTFDSEVLPEMFQLAADGKVTIDTHSEKLENIEQAWNLEVGAGKRLVIEI